MFMALLSYPKEIGNILILQKNVFNREFFSIKEQNYFYGRTEALSYLIVKEIENAVRVSQKLI